MIAQGVEARSYQGGFRLPDSNEVQCHVEQQPRRPLPFPPLDRPHGPGDTPDGPYFVVTPPPPRSSFNIGQATLGSTYPHHCLCQLAASPVLICGDHVLKQQAIQFAAISNPYASGTGARVDQLHPRGVVRSTFLWAVISIPVPRYRLPIFPARFLQSRSP